MLWKCMENLIHRMYAPYSSLVLLANYIYIYYMQISVFVVGSRIHLPSRQHLHYLKIAELFALLLQSLTVTFEGQSEVIIQDIGYAPIRLCSVTRELAPSEPPDLSNDGHEDSDKPCTWNIVFNLPVPGWLPATSAFAVAGTRYSLFATAFFVNMDDNSDRMWSFSTLCSLFRPKTRVIHAPKCSITLRRFT